MQMALFKNASNGIVSDFFLHGGRCPPERLFSRNQTYCQFVYALEQRTRVSVHSRTQIKDCGKIRRYPLWPAALLRC